MEFVGQVDRGRWTDRLKGMDDKEDVGELLVGEELATTRQDVFIKREIFLKIDSQPSPNVDS